MLILFVFSRMSDPANAAFMAGVNPRKKGASVHMSLWAGCYIPRVTDRIGPSEKVAAIERDRMSAGAVPSSDQH